MDKKLLLIINPCSGTRQIKRHLADVVDVFTRAGYASTVLTTTALGDAAKYALQYAGRVDLIVAAGGDGTFNETISGVIASEKNTPVGYIPCGSTNDFAGSLKLTSNIDRAAKNIMTGQPKAMDAGSFNGRVFSYVACCGAFTEASYSTPQSRKNILGHLAYILEGIGSLGSLRPVHLKVETHDKLFEDEYIFASVSNSTSLAGVLTLSSEYVNMCDGELELMLIKMPKNPIQLGEIVADLKACKYDSELITFISAPEFHITAEDEGDWSLDGEHQEGVRDIEIKVLHNAFDLVLNGEQDN